MTAVCRLCAPMLSLLQNLRRGKTLCRCLVSLKYINLHNVDNKARLLCRRYYSGSQSLTDILNSFQYSVTEKNSCLSLKKGEASDSQNVTYIEKENEYFHSYLSNLIHYKSFFLCGSKRDHLKETVYSSDSTEELFNLNLNEFNIGEDKLMHVLEELSHLPTSQHVNLFLNKNFHHLCKCLLMHLATMDDETYFKSMAVLSGFDFRCCMTSELRSLRIFIAKSFDQENVRRMSEWDARQLLLAADFYFHLRCSSLSWISYLQLMFSRLFVSKIFNDLKKLELVMLMFHVSLAREIGERQLSDALFKICQDIESYSIEELGIVSLAYFKTNKPVRNQLFQKELVSKLNCCVDRIEPICLSAVLKCLQKSTNKIRMRYQPDTLNLLISLQPRLSQRMSSLTPQTALHVISVFHSFKYISEELVSSFSVNLVEENLDEWRLKDLALAVRFLADLSECFPHRAEILEKLNKELMSPQRNAEIASHLDYLARFLLGMAMSGVYSQPLLQRLFEPESLDFFADHKINIYRDLYQLSESVKIECPSYSGPLLPNNIAKAQKKKSYIAGRPPQRQADGDIFSISKRDELMQQCVHSLDCVLGGQQHIHVDFLLPHYQTADIELNVIPSHQGSSEEELHPFHSDILSSHQRIAILLYGENAYYSLIGLDSSVRNVLLGNHVMKRRQLKQIGFRIIEVPFYEFKHLDRNKTNEYILNKLKDAGLLSKSYLDKLVLPV